MTPGQVEQWKWERVAGVRVPVVSVEERLERDRLHRSAFLSSEEVTLKSALDRKLYYRVKKIGEANQAQEKKS